MRIEAIDVTSIRLPFRFSFGHSLAARSCSDSLIVTVRLSDGTEGHGEGIPREYVTGESIEGAAAAVRDIYAPCLTGAELGGARGAVTLLGETFGRLGLAAEPRGASWCALELAVLDAAAKAEGISLADALGPPRRTAVRYGGVVPFGGRAALIAILAFYRLYGFATVKLKVGRDLESDLGCLRLARRILGESVKLRVDANCAWTLDQALAAVEAMRPFGVASFEQPLPAGDLDGLARLTAAVPEQVVVDESLRTLDEAAELCQRRACSGFNIRVSKVGGLIAAGKMASLAREHGIACHLGAQVGESGILSAAGRLLACLEEPFDNYEGSDNLFLLKSDLTRENLTVSPGGWGSLLPGPGLGVTVVPERMAAMAVAGKASVVDGEPAVLRTRR